MIKLFAEIGNKWKPLTFSAKSSIINTWLVPKYLSFLSKKNVCPYPYMGQGIKNGSSKIYGKQPLRNLKYILPKQTNFFEGCLPQILLGPFLSNLTNVWHFVTFFRHFLKILGKGSSRFSIV